MQKQELQESWVPIIQKNQPFILFYRIINPRDDCLSFSHIHTTRPSLISCVLYDTSHLIGLEFKNHKYKDIQRTYYSWRNNMNTLTHKHTRHTLHTTIYCNVESHISFRNRKNTFSSRYMLRESSLIEAWLKKKNRF